jgi:O-acetylserine/cysteine efflux transporter
MVRAGSLQAKFHPGSVPAVPLRGVAVLLLSVVLLSSAWPLTKLAIGHGAAPLWFAEGRAVLSGLTAAALLAAMGRMVLPVRRDLPAMVSVGLFQLAAFFAFAHLAVAWVPAGRTAVLASTTTIFVVPLSVLVLGETITPRRWLATIVGLAGIAVLVGPWAINWASPRALIGNGFLLCAALSWAVALITVRRAPPRHSMFELVPWCFLLGSLALLPAVLAEEPHAVLGQGAAAWGPLLYIGLLAGPLGTWGVMEAAMLLPAVVSSVGYLATPAVGILLSAWILGEPITPDLVGGTVLILAGVGVAAWPGRAR